MKELSKKDYESPQTKKTQVISEDGFMKASIVPEKVNKVESTGQEMGETFDGSGWNDSEWQ